MAVISRRGRGNMVAQTLARSKNWRLLSASWELLSASCRRLLMPRQFLGKGGIAGFLSEESKCFSLKNSRKKSTDDWCTWCASSWMGLRLKSLKCSCCPLDNHEDFLFEKCTTLHFSSWDDSGCPSGRKKRGRPDVSFAQIILPFCPSSMQRWD